MCIHILIYTYTNGLLSIALMMTHFKLPPLYYSVHVKHKIFLSAIQYLPFSPEYDDPEDERKGTFEEIIER